MNGSDFFLILLNCFQPYRVKNCCEYVKIPTLRIVKTKTHLYKCVTIGTDKKIHSVFAGFGLKALSAACRYFYKKSVHKALETRKK